MKDYEFYLKVRHKYKVTKCGKVYSLYYSNRMVTKKREVPLLLKCSLISSGYKRVCLYHNGLKLPVSVHRLVAFEYIGKPKSNTTSCGHKNDIKTDNRVENLHWISARQNAQDARINGKLMCGINQGHSKLSLDQVKDVFIQREAGKKLREIADKFNVSTSTIFGILKGSTWAQALIYDKQTLTKLKTAMGDG